MNTARSTLIEVPWIVGPAALERHDVVNDVAGAGTRGLAGRGAWWWCSKSRLAVSLRLILPWLSRVTPTAARLEEWLVREPRGSKNASLEHARACATLPHGG